MATKYKRIARFRTPEQLEEYLDDLDLHLPFDSKVQTGGDAPLAQPYQLEDQMIGNRFCILPMEGWDGTREGQPTERTHRRWSNFGRSGAKLIWGGEAVAVREDGRANPNQLMLKTATVAGLAELRRSLIRSHEQVHGDSSDLMVGLQLTHSGRFARPTKKDRLEPLVVYRHPPLEELYGVADRVRVLTDDEIYQLIEDFIRAAGRASEIGFDFVDIKHCHGYLGHEFLSAYSRQGAFGGSLENRTRFLREIVVGIHERSPGLKVGVRISLFDFPPFREDEEGRACPFEYRDEEGRYPFAFGGDPWQPTQIKLEEPLKLMALLADIGVDLVNLSAGSPYYNPHIQRPAYFPPSDGYSPPEDPLQSVARQLNAVAAIKAQMQDLPIVGTGYSYLQEWLPNVAQFAVRTGRVDFVGLGRMALSYPEFPADVLAGRELDRKRICRTFSDCTTAPRSGLISGCYPLDDYYGDLPEAEKLAAAKQTA